MGKGGRLRHTPDKRGGGPLETTTLCLVHQAMPPQPLRLMRLEVAFQELEAGMREKSAHTYSTDGGLARVTWASQPGS